MIQYDKFTIPAKCISTFCLSEKLKNILRGGCYYNIFITKAKLPIIEIEYEGSSYNVNISRFDMEINLKYFNRITNELFMGKITENIFYGRTMNNYHYIKDENVTIRDNDIDKYSLVDDSVLVKNTNSVLKPEYFSQKQLDDVLEILDSVNQLPIKNKKKESLQKFIDAVSDLSNNTISGIKLK